MGEITNQILTWIVSILGGVSLSAILTGVVVACIKGGINRMIAKVNVKQISDNATEKGLEKIKDVSFTHSIQPVVESKLKEINEYYVEVLEKELKVVKEQYNNVVNILEKQAKYFDNSVAVSEEAKAELKKAIEIAKNEPSEVKSVVVEQTTKEDTKKPLESKSQSESTISVER